MLTIITPAAATDLTTVAAVKGELGITDLIRQASGAIATHCGRAFASERVRETIRLSAPAPSITLSRWPVTAVQAVVVGGTALAPDAYEVDPDTGILTRLDGFGLTVPWPTGSIAIEYTGGFILPGQDGRTLPHDIERACLDTVAATWNARGRDPLVRSEKAFDVLATSYLVDGFTGLPPSAMGLLAPFRRRLGM